MTRRAMLLRGFKGRFTTLRSFRLGRGEKLLLAGGALFAALLVALEVLHV